MLQLTIPSIIINQDVLLGKADLDTTLEAWYQVLTWTMLATALPVFIILLLGISAPYGRYSRNGWGFLLDARLAWLTQEAPSLVIFTAMVVRFGGPALFQPPLTPRAVLAVAFCAHYVYRALAFPFLLRGGKPTPLSVWAMSFVFCVWNGYIQGWGVARHMPDGAHGWTPRVLCGLALWLFGWINVMRSDWILIHLRKPGETGYKIPHGGMFEFVSAGNYASEILEWAGFALAAGTLPSLAFALFAFCNLAPRGHHHHRWYQQKFREEYPPRRRAVVPFIW